MTKMWRITGLILCLVMPSKEVPPKLVDIDIWGDSTSNSVHSETVEKISSISSNVTKSGSRTSKGETHFRPHNLGQ